MSLKEGLNMDGKLLLVGLNVDLEFNNNVTVVASSLPIEGFGTTYLS